MSSTALKPVDNFTDAYPLLRRPFTPAAIRFKIQATFSGGAMIVAFVDARLASGRLNAVIPAKWSAVYERPAQGKGLICHLTVDGITRTDFGQSDYENAKGDYSDALKRAAVQFGVGESLYVLPKFFLKEGALLKPMKSGNPKLTPQGENYCRTIYAEWLEKSGSKTFGEPLDHGDQVFATEETPDSEPTPMDELAQLIEEVGFSDEEKDGLREWIKQDREVHTETAIDLLRDGNKAAVMAGVEFEAEVVK